MTANETPPPTFEHLLFPFLHNWLNYEIRTPLNTILAYTELLLQEPQGPLNDAQREDVATIRQQGQTIREIINLLLDVFNLKQDRQRLSLDEVQIRSVIERIPEPAKSALIVQTPNQLPSLWGDLYALGIYFSEVILAISHKGQKGPVVLTVHSDSEWMTLEFRNATLTLSKNAFQNYTEVVSAGSLLVAALPESLRLGISKSVIELHGGTMVVENDKENGAVVVVRLPVRKGA